MLRYADYDIVFQEIPDEVTLAINLSNCPNHCKGCHSAYLMEDIGEPLTEESLSTLLGKYGKAITCVCFMGGDASPAISCFFTQADHHSGKSRMVLREEQAAGAL